MSSSNSSLNWIYQKFREPLDRLAFVLIGILTVLLIALLIAGNQTAPRVRHFSWQQQQVGSDDRAFILTFSRPMNHGSVEENLRIDPLLTGKISWAGRRMAYTLTQPIPYGQNFKLQLQAARDLFAKPGDIESLSEPFIGTFCSRDRAFVYLGASPEEQGQLVLYNLTKQETRILTPKDLVVMDYKIYPQGDRILFSALPRSEGGNARSNASIYQVKTGISLECSSQNDSTTPPNSIELLKPEQILDSDQYQNLRFELSADGKTILVNRINLQNPSDSGLWIIREGRKPQPLGNQPGGNFLFTPDSKTVAILQGQGVAILPLEPNSEPLDFIPKFEMLFDFTRDGTAAAMGTFNRDPKKSTRSLFFFTNQGVETELFRTEGSILDAKFDPTNQILYCLITKLIEEEEEYREEPLIAALNIETKKLTPLVLLPNQRNIQMSLSPDGLGLLFDQESQNRSSAPTSADPTQSNSRLWLIPLDINALIKEDVPQIEPQLLPFVGIRPQWLP
ncbi:MULTISPECIES: hypothetical protein [Planktothricoides]|uniref:SbsA Ig-like domain-containing protein n=2 Tax=Planktothricoides raciborskii TaxID=132608 RepID=A0AAU8JB35_9CYAN|nr:MULTISPECIES: hypothetical protein [Planktothricoides]KOR35372.1 hypothetical protein AM228_18665 [Planktothricoides sp. SR001]MBD2546003.1 hypothetical protein [Planktothricoides raciborskii FACHB-1370]MBD2583352.1 hypothetical protein [Planktothricoides raciborskii FACHB-1261]